MSRIVYKIDTNGILTELDLDTGDSLRIMQTAVGGYIERVPLSDHLDMYVNENGLYENLPENPVGTLLYTSRNPDFPNRVVGDILLAGGITKDEETAGLDEITREDIQALLVKL